MDTSNRDGRRPPRVHRRYGFLASARHMGGCIGVVVAATFRIADVISTRLSLVVLAVFLGAAGLALGPWVVQFGRKAVHFVSEPRPPSVEPPGSHLRDYLYLDSKWISNLLEQYGEISSTRVTVTREKTETDDVRAGIGGPSVNIGGGKGRASRKGITWEGEPTAIHAYGRLEDFFRRDGSLRHLEAGYAGSSPHQLEYWSIPLTRINIEGSEGIGSNLAAHATNRPSLVVEAQLIEEMMANADLGGNSRLADATIVGRVDRSENVADGRTRITLKALAIFR